MPLSPPQPPPQPPPQQRPLSRLALHLRWGVLGFLVAPTLLVILHWLGYEVKLWGCPLKALVGIPCPTWGMTRAMLAIADGHWSTAVKYHLLAPLVLICWVLFLGQIGLELWHRRATVWSRWWRHRITWLSGLFITLGYHGSRLYQLWSSGTLGMDIQQSFLGHFILSHLLLGHNL
ncbi:MAG: DUF2752 domain-containing protein [Cyanobacteria bacterium P01_D01_bin.44]